MPVLFRRDAHLVSREGCQFVRFLVTADEGRDFLARPVGEFDNAPHVPGGLDSIAIFLREGMPRRIAAVTLGIENTVAANDYPAVGGFTQGKLAVVGWEIESRLKYTRTVLSVWKPRNIWSSIPFCSICSRLMPRLVERVPIYLFHVVLVLRLLLCLPLLRCICRLLLLLPGGRLRLLLALLLCLCGMLYLVLCHTCLSFGRGVLHGLLEICRYPLHILFRHTEEMETVGSFNWFQRLEKKLENISPWRSTRSRSLLSSNGSWFVTLRLLLR